VRYKCDTIIPDGRCQINARSKHKWLNLLHGFFDNANLAEKTFVLFCLMVSWWVQTISVNRP